MSNVAGQATAFMAITPIHSGEEATLRRYLDALPQRGSPLERLNGTHFARWVILTDWVNDPGQGREDHLDSAYLIFTRSRMPPAGEPGWAVSSTGSPTTRIGAVPSPILTSTSQWPALDFVRSAFPRRLPAPSRRSSARAWPPATGCWATSARAIPSSGTAAWAAAPPTCWSSSTRAQRPTSRTS